MISLKNTLEAIKTKLSAHDTKMWYISDMAKSEQMGGTSGYGYDTTITWKNIPSNATNIKFIPTFMRWMAPVEISSISKSGTTITIKIHVACVVSTGVGTIGGVLMYQLS